jgi:hypothetical protein
VVNVVKVVKMKRVVKDGEDIEGGEVGEGSDSDKDEPRVEDLIRSLTITLQ